MTEYTQPVDRQTAASQTDDKYIAHRGKIYKRYQTVRQTAFRQPTYCKLTKYSKLLAGGQEIDILQRDLADRMKTDSRQTYSRLQFF